MLYLGYDSVQNVVIRYAVVWQHVISMVCVLLAVFSATTQHSEQ